MPKHAVSRKEKSSSGENSSFLSEFTLIFPVCLSLVVSGCLV